MKITYIHHSSFSLELGHSTLLFDYYQGQIPVFDKKKPIYVFASHKHGDHFDLKIFDLVHTCPDITFILSSDIKMNEAYMERKNIPEAARNRILYVNKNSTYELPPLTINTLTSTDEGVAFLINTEGKNIYHAGDLNWWTWEENTEEEDKEMAALFHREIDKLSHMKIDAAFLPLDPRQGSRFWWGFDYFMKTTDTAVAFPMHFWKDYTVINKLKAKEEAKEYSGRIMDINEEGQQFEI